VSPAVRYRCGPGARWLPRVAGGALLAAAMIVGLRMPSGPPAGAVRLLVIAAGALGGLWLVRAGSEVRLEVELGEHAMRFVARGRFVELRFDDVEGMDFDPAFGSRRAWPPAFVLIDRHERRWRIPAFLVECPVLVREIVSRSPDERVRAWAEARRVESRTRRSRWLVPAGYLAAAVLVASAVTYAALR
jgi:hypothetical protein